MTDVAVPLMMLVMICAASCALLDRCRTVAGIVCAIAMVLGMFDALYTRLLPLPVVMALMVATGLWAAVSGWPGHAPYDLFFRLHRGAASTLMAFLLFRHTNTGDFIGDICSRMVTAIAPADGLHQHHGLAAALSSLSPDSLGSIGLLIAGVLLTIAIVRSQSSNTRKLSGNIAALEPSLMGLSLVLMAT